MDEETLKILTSDNKKLAASPRTLEYHRSIKNQVKEILEVAEKAKSKGFDPKKKVEIYIAQDVASRTEGLVGPPGVAKRLLELEEIEKLPKDKIVIKIAKEIAAGKLMQGSPEVLADQALRTALSYQTESITAAPIEGISAVTIKTNIDNTSYLAVYYAGPIRSAGGTAQGVSIYIADEIRKELKLERYKATEKEVERMLEEVRLYNKIMHLQLPTSDDEIRHAWRNIPIQVTGDATEDEEVSGYRNIDSMDTNRVRGGACLVLNDGLVGRAKKITKRTKKLKLKGWDWLVEIADGKYTDKRASEGSGEEKPTQVLPDYSFASDALMGRPTFSDATAEGGFRLRYGHARSTGIAGIGVHSGIMSAVDDFLAPGTHVRTERPGKGSIVVPIDTIKAPIVLLKNGDVVDIPNYEVGKQLRSQIKEIIFMGDMLVGVGEFIQNNYRLCPSGYNPEWWALELREKGWTGMDGKHEIQFFENLMRHPPSYDDAIQLSKQFDVPLHPKYTPAWVYLSPEEVKDLHDSLWQVDAGVLPMKCKSILETSYILHKVVDEGLDIGDFHRALRLQLPKDATIDLNAENGFIIIKNIAEVPVRDLIGTTIGARMGRPEKAKARLMKPKLHGLFPVGDQKKVRKELGRAMEQRHITVDMSNRHCSLCNISQFQLYCQKCGEETKLMGRCMNSKCGRSNEEGPCDHCGSRVIFTKPYTLNMIDFVSSARSRLGTFPSLVKLKDQLKNPSGIPELLDKGILRAEYDLNVFRDGTIRYDATDAPLTHFYPNEISTDIATLVKLGYTHDIFGEELIREDQLLELKVQDIIISDSSINHLIHVSRFVDNELEKIYKLPKYYNIQSDKDLLGQLVIGLAPHTSAGVIGRIVGFTKSSVCWAHPFWHASKRRNCVAYNEEILLYNVRSQSIIRKEIGKIVEEIDKNRKSLDIKQKIVDDFGTIALSNPFSDLRALSIDEESNEVILQPIKHWIRGTTDQWIKVTTKTGRCISMTPGHEQLVWDRTNQVFRKKKARDLTIHDELPILHHIPENLIQSYHDRKINLLKEFSQKLPRTRKFTTFRDDLRLRQAHDWMKDVLTDFAHTQLEKEALGSQIVVLGTKQVTRYLREIFSDLLPAVGSTVFSFRWYRSIPLSHLEVLESEGVFNWDDVPAYAKLGISRDDSISNVYLDLDVQLIRLLGYYISEGYSRDEYGCYQTNFSVPDSIIRAHVADLITHCFGSEPYFKEDNGQLVHVNKIHMYLLSYAWKMNHSALTKRLPPYIFNLSRELKIQFLSAIIDGDGSFINSANRISLYTGNQNLSKDYTLLCSSLGVFARIHQVKGSRYGKAVLERYKELGKKPKVTKGLYHVNITGIELIPILKKLQLTHVTKQNIVYDYLANQKLANTSNLQMCSETTLIDRIKEIEIINGKAISYCLEVESSKNINHSMIMSDGLISGQCDGDEDGIILLMDGFLNFSKEYLPTTRGSKMDTPLVLVATLNPNEVDDEAFNLDSMTNYGLEFYNAADAFEMPSTLSKKIHRAEQRLGTEGQYEGFVFSHATSDISEGPLVTRYKDSSLNIRDKLNEQLHLANIIRAVNVKETALRILEKHALPDLQGNLRAFASQQVRCVTCNTKYRRIPLSGTCKNPKCLDSKIILTVPPKGVSKYFDVCTMLVKDYGLGHYHEDRMERIKMSLDSLFPEDSEDVMDLSDWF
ncbi:MAG: DNA polymerase II large subunit [Candidatus Heimdallarchaeota archaeon]|nr:DNA polymerase II large subunit [Candidatus Heimdallarchaeota archaeon]